MLINTVADLQKYVEVNSGLQWATIKPSLKAAEQKYLVPAIGPELYQLIDEAAASASLSTAEQALLPYLQAPVALLAMYLFVPRGEIQLSDSGLQRIETEGNKTAFKYQSLAYRDALLDAGYEAIEALLEYLEKNKTAFAAWIDSDARVAMNDLFVRSGRELKHFYSSLRQPQRTYIAMASMLRTVEDLTITPIIGDTFAELKDAQAAGGLTLYEKMLTDTLKKCIVYFAMSKALVELELRIDDTGITMLAQRGDNSRGEDGNRAAADAKRIGRLADQLEAAALQYLDTAVRYLTINATLTVFPTWYAKLQADALAAVPVTDINPLLSGAFSL